MKNTIYEEIMKFYDNDLREQLKDAMKKQKESYEKQSRREFNYWRTQIELIENRIQELCI